MLIYSGTAKIEKLTPHVLKAGVQRYVIFTVR